MKPKRLTDALPIDVLRKYWRYDTFRPLQSEVIQSVLDGYDTLALMPTGGGKSLTFQVPAMLCEGLTLVISPLVALMKDQVDDLKRHGIRANYLHSGQTRSEMLAVLDGCTFSYIKLLYVSPERLSNALFLKRLESIEVSLIVVDEAHCISQWGYDFRPDYLKIKGFRLLYPDVPLLALTATATPRVTEDIQRQLAFREPHKLFQKSFYRENLTYVVRNTDDKPREILHILSRVEGSALVYVRSRVLTRKISDLLNSSGIKSDYFHAGLSPKVKERKQNAWQSDEVRVMVCTNAFGMGINKPDVRLVIHPTPPPSLEFYYQEAGRAARDDQQSYAVLLYTPVKDENYLAESLRRSFPSLTLIRGIYDALGNYFQLGVESGEGALYEFDIYDFCSRYRVSSRDLVATFGILQLSGYLEYLENHDRMSTITILVDRNDLYSLFSEREVAYDDVLEYLMRHYAGLFTEYVAIDEWQICQALKLKPDQLVTLLSQLRKWHVIDYIPGKRGNYIHYLTQRVEAKRLVIPKDIYRDRYRKAKHRMVAVEKYLSSNNTCRSMQLVTYFGDTEPLPCGYCDYCISIDYKGLTYKKIVEIRDIIIQKGHISMAELASALPQLSNKEIHRALSHLSNDGYPIRIDANIIFYGA